MADRLSGRIPATRLERWQDFSELLESDLFNTNGVQFTFRGHRRYDWSLLPTLGRLTENGIVSAELAEKQLDLFRRAVRGRLKDTSLLVESEQEDELWSVGQHHGLMTPLLDWTYSPYVALFFAFAKEDQQGEEDNPYRAVYVLNKSFVADDDQCPDIRLLEPRKDDHGRLVNQAGLFTFSPTDATIENKLIETISDFDEFKEAAEESEADVLARYICKIYIRNEDREGCLRSLRRMNVHHASLFPDLIGASDYCNLLMEEAHRQQAIEEGAIEKEVSDTVKLGDEVTAEIIPAEVPEDLNEVERLTALLNGPEKSSQVEPGRIQLIAKQLSKEFEKHKVVDWESRDAIQAKLRNIARVILRKYSYPVALRDPVTEKILAALSEAQKDESEGVQEE
ncbi:FRG domain-containing protein [Desulfobacter latus]|uniref:FRG domain-containing protein n=1 Tax=Desulfobacter latus TaxID=2292 RepID=A0A850T9S4_9BACT|nr:FRG domain-containing protein [Desulfobacter latus]NWH04116.1 FRG domain-containing protein [Desulfobacter latus]